MLTFRRIYQRERMLRQVMARLRCHGLMAEIAFPMLDTYWIPVSEENGSWKGWILLREILQCASPALADLAITPTTIKLISEWLNHTQRPFSFSVPELKYNKLIFGSVYDGIPAEGISLVRVRDEQMSLWLEDMELPYEKQTEALPFLEAIYWPVVCLAGISRTTVCCLESVRLGDVLLISTILQHALSYNHYLFSWSWNEENTVSEDIHTEELIEKSMMINHIDEIPVQIEFILHRFRLTLDEIKSYAAGEAFILPEGCEKKVEIQVNGLTVGYGELVEIDKRLGVEVSNWLKGTSND